MKIRVGFVANSSSVSFCIYGALVNANDPIIFDTIKRLLVEHGKEDEAWKLDESSYKYELISQWLDEFSMKLGLTIHNDQDGYDLYIGRSWDSIKDDETGKQFKDTTSKLVNQLLPDVKCLTYQEAWFEG